MSNARPGPVGVIAVPTLPWMWAASVQAFLRLLFSTTADLAIRFEDGLGSIAAKRNLLVREALRMPSVEWVLFIDSDMTPPPDLVQRLLAHGDLDMVSAVCHQRWPPHRVCLIPLEGLAGVRSFDTGPGAQLVEVSMAGFGAVLVRRRVFETLPDPWFEHPEAGLGEDTVFCERARAAGFRIFADLSLDVGHMTVLPIDGARAYAWQQLAHEESPAGAAARAQHTHDLPGG